VAAIAVALLHQRAEIVVGLGDAARALEAAQPVLHVLAHHVCGVDAGAREGAAAEEGVEGLEGVEGDGLAGQSLNGLGGRGLEGCGCGTAGYRGPVGVVCGGGWGGDERAGSGVLSGWWYWVAGLFSEACGGLVDAFFFQYLYEGREIQRVCVPPRPLFRRREVG